VKKDQSFVAWFRFEVESVSLYLFYFALRCHPRSSRHCFGIERGEMEAVTLNT
jgi:hypothetical protein